jgi:hypothetical protein
MAHVLRAEWLIIEQAGTVPLLEYSLGLPIPYPAILAKMFDAFDKNAHCMPGRIIQMDWRIRRG